MRVYVRVCGSVDGCMGVCVYVHVQLCMYTYVHVLEWNDFMGFGNDHVTQKQLMLTLSFNYSGLPLTFKYSDRHTWMPRTVHFTTSQSLC